MPTTPVDRVRGMLDLLPDEHQRQTTIANALEEHIRLYGYRAIDLPIIEQTELFLRKVGQEMAGKLYAFRHHNRDLCLRPELTASVMRAYVAHYQHAGLPLRLAYTGPVFRYETPQRGRYRQFTEIGVELIGAPAPTADAEVIHLAAAGLDRLGLHDYQVVIGHIGIAQTFLAGLNLDERVRHWLTWSMEDLRQVPPGRLPPALAALLPENSAEAHDRSAPEPLTRATDGAIPSLPDGWATLPPAEAEQAVLQVLRSAGLNLAGSSRSPEEIARRLVGKLGRSADHHAVERALAFLRRLAELRGQPAAVLTDLRDLLAEEHLSDEPLQQVEELLADLAAYGLPLERVTLDAGLGRGLHYYTGLIFEIYADGERTNGRPGDDGQLAGGGRYDDLALVLGARERVPACGFAYGLERIAEALTRRQAAPAAATLSPQVLVCAISSEQRRYAIRVATSLRAVGWSVELDVRQRGVRGNLEIANRRAVPIVVIVGADEERASTYRWHEMANRQEETRSLDPATQPPGPATRPPGPATQPPGPATRPPGPATQPPDPATRPPGPAARPPGPADPTP